MSNSNKRGILLIAHGSKLSSSNDEIRALADAIKKQSEDDLWVEPAFMEIADPSIPQMLLEAHLKGIRLVKVLPCFISAGVHVTKDLTSLIDQARHEYEEMHIEVLPHLGALPGLTEFLVNAIDQD